MLVSHEVKIHARFKRFALLLSMAAAVVALAATSTFALRDLNTLISRSDVPGRLGRQHALQEAVRADSWASILIAGALVIGVCLLVSQFLAMQQRLAQAATTEASELAARSSKRTASLIEANHDLESFSYAASHDLRAPLRVIEGIANMLSEDLSDRLKPGERRLFERIQLNTTRMSDLIEAMLSLAQVSRQVAVSSPVDLSLLASDLVAESLSECKNAQTTVTLEPNMVAQGDRQQLRMLLDNLLSNGIKFSANVQEPKVSFGKVLAAGETVYFVRDNGIGFDMNQSAGIFEPFQRLHSGDAFEGSGIGLATCQKIVHRHHGRIWAESCPNGGSTFFFTLGMKVLGKVEPAPLVAA